MSNQTQQLSQLLQQAGLRVRVVRTNAPYRPAWIGAIPGVRAIFRLVPYLVELWRISARVGILHIMANSGWAWHLLAAPAVWIGKMRGVAVIVNYRGGDAAGFLKRSHRWVTPTMRLADRVIVPSGYLQQVFAGYGIASQIVPNIIDLHCFARKSSDDAPGADPVILVARHLEPLYDVATAIRAFAIVRRKYPGATLVVAGDGPERARLVALTEELGVQDRVEFTGRLTNSKMAGLYARADAVVNTSLLDNMPISILEALAVGVPVVSTDVGGIPYLVTDGETALLAPPRDTAKIAAALLRILGDHDLRSRLIESGWQLVQQFTWERVRPRLLRCYSEFIPVAGQCKSPASLP
ncbi:MAG: glycosyltransferase family 4 protein [Steroidobacteraceae bacterium]|nr:glycosyltransferase family 4 protein [Steroidobacteraceae bacterium]